MVQKTCINLLAFNIRHIPFANLPLLTAKFNWILSSHPSVICLTEVTISYPQWDKIWNTKLKDHLLKDFVSFSNQDQTDSRGIIVLVRKNLPITADPRDLVIINKDLYKITFSYKNNNLSLVLFVVYGPSHTDDPHFFLNLREQMALVDCSDVIICGDFNTTLDTDLDRYNYRQDSHHGKVAQRTQDRI